MLDVYDIMAELLLEGHGDKLTVLCPLYEKYIDKGLPHDRLRKIFVRNGYLKPVKKEIKNDLRQE